MPHAVPPHRSMPLPALPHSALPSAAAPMGCCTSRLPPPSGTETTAAAAGMTASVPLHAHTSSKQNADADLPPTAPPVPLPSALQTSSGPTALSPAPLLPGSPAAPPIANARPAQKSCPGSLPALLPARPHTLHTTLLLPPFGDRHTPRARQTRAAAAPSGPASRSSSAAT